MLEYRYDTQLLIEGENLDEDEINDYKKKILPEIIKQAKEQNAELNSIELTEDDIEFSESEEITL